MNECPHGHSSDGGCSICSIKDISDESTFIGLDMSLTGTGFALKRGTTFQVETIKTKPKDFKNELDRLNHIVAEVMKRIPKVVTLIVIEDYFTPSNRQQIGAAIRLVALSTLMRNAMYQAKLPFYIITAQQIKKFATGKGNSPKSIIIREVFKRWGFEAKDDNQADAFSMAHMAEAMMADNLDHLTNPQRETVEKVVKERPHYNIEMKVTE